MQDIKLDLKYFHWHKETRTLIAELSTLEFVIFIALHGEMPDYITVNNPNTKQSRVFRYLKVEKDDEFETKAWHYENLSHALKLTIWND